MSEHDKKRFERARAGGLPFGRPGAMFMGEKPADFRGTFRKLLRYLAPYRLSILIVILLAAGSSVFSIAGPKILGNVTTSIFEGLVGKVAGLPGAGVDFSYVGRVLLLLLGLYAASAAFAYVQGFIIAGVAQEISYNLRREIAEKINRLPLKYFDVHTHGDVLSRVTNDVDTVSQTLNQSLSQIITSLVMLIGVLVMMLSISGLMTLGTVAILPLSMLLVSFVIRRSQKYFRDHQHYLGLVNGHVEEIYGGHLIVKAFNGEEKAIGEFDRYNDELYDSAWKSQFISGMMMPIMHFIGNLGFVLTSILGGWLAARGTIMVGDILAFIQYSRQFSQPISQVAQISNIIQSTIAAAERVFEFLEEKEEEEDPRQPVSTGNLREHVSFKNVRFGYDPGNPVIKNFNAEVAPGQRVAIVGPTGAGKTTIVKLLMRFYDVTGGAITIDGHDIRNFKRDELRGMFGMVLQDTWLFNGTIMENIRFGNLEASDEEVERAARAAYAHPFIKALPHGYRMLLNEEASNLSQGQKQLLTIARAILADPRILILDEATSSVDTRTEILIQKAMANLMKDRTSFIIAHRLQTIRDADLILVMNEGDIVETGRHEELLAAGGFYASLYYSQFDAAGAS